MIFAFAFYGTGGTLIGILTYILWLNIYKISIENKLRNIELQILQSGSEELQEKIEENFFTKLVQINFKYLDQYYLQTQQQANRSFILSSLAAFAGFSIVVIGITLMFMGKTSAAYVTTTAGVISECIAALFFYLYNRTILKMSQYHQKLVATQNINLALKISEGMSGEARVRAQEQIIDRLTVDINKYLLLDTI